MFPLRDHNPSQRTPYVTYVLMAANILIFIAYWPMFDTPREINNFFYTWALMPAQIQQGNQYYGFVTSMFLHGGLMHLGGNMLFLWIFGDNMEDEWGHVGFLGFYLGCGILAGLTHYAADPSSTVPTVGASGAIAAVMGGYVLLFPKAKVDILFIFIIIFRIIPVPAWVMLGAWFALQLFGGFSAPLTGGGVAYWAHAGGFVVGMLATLPLWMIKGGTGFWQRTDMHPPHPDATYKLSRSSIPKVRRK
ncbi:rhomboid family intramembrane serine protease [Algirhabdus cladophorae]|uniref:rhomboid family intramembrane serine protease n=1 Tax=Algirhabdus cladophorae TaxID=3377108 RepID=UPI003B84A45A